MGTAYARGLWQRLTAVRGLHPGERGSISPVPSPPQYIVAFAAKVLTGQMRELKDLREYDMAEAQSPKPNKAE